MDALLKNKISTYNNIKASLTASQRSHEYVSVDIRLVVLIYYRGNLSTKNIYELVHPRHLVSSEHLQTVFVAIPKCVITN